MNKQPKNPLIWRPRDVVSDANQRGLWENLRYLRDISEETSLINFPGDVSETCILALFEISLKHFKDASEMQPCRLEIIIFYYILLTEQISFSDYLYFLRYWTICALQLFVSHVATP